MVMVMVIYSALESTPAAAQQRCGGGERRRHDNLCAIQLIELQELMNYVGRLDAQSATLFAAR